jgi:hypothetical protein
MLLQDNAWPNIVGTTVNLLNTWHCDILAHSPYTPDLAPFDFQLFHKPMKHLQGLTNSMVPEPESLSPCTQEPTNNPYPKPGESTPHPPNQSP